MTRDGCRLGDRWTPPARYIATETGMEGRIMRGQRLHREIYMDGVVEGVKIGLVVAICLVVMAGVIVWL